MKSFKQLSVSAVACLVLASTLPMGCQAPTTQTPTSNPSSSVTTTSGSTAAVSGVVYKDYGTDGRLVPPDTAATVQVLDDGKEVASVKTDLLGRFYIGNIPAPKEGKNYVIKVANLYEEAKTLFPGRVLNLSSIKTLAQTNTQQAQQLQRVTGILVNKDNQPLANVEVRDKTSPFRKTTTDATGRFTLEILGQDIEVLNGLVPIVIAASEFQTRSTVQVDTTNIRTITGKIIDKTNSNVILSNVRVKVQSSSVSARSDDAGNFSLSGAPVAPFILEVESPKGYAPFSVEIPPAIFDAGTQRPQNYTQNLSLQPVGSIQINFVAETAPGFDRLPPVRNPDYTASSNVETPPQICGSYINCDMFPLTGPNAPPRPIYNNTLAVLNELTAFVSVEGSGVTQQIAYPPAPFQIVYGSDPATGEPVKVDDQYYAGNVVMSVKLDDIPGGRQSVTISMTGFQTQKSIPVYVPPNDTISTELITLYRVEPISSFGDVKGVIRGTKPLPGGKELRIVYLDVKEDLNYEPILGDATDPELLERIQEALDSDRSETATENNKGPDGRTGTADDTFMYHEYYLKNVPTGSRIMLAAAVVDDDGELSDCYIPNTSVLLNVRASQINLAPDLELTLRPTESNCSND